MMRRILLPAELDHERLRATKELIRKHHRRYLVTTGYVHQKRSNYYAYIHTRRLKHEDRKQQMEIF
jgi:hypothetical protein